MTFAPEAPRKVKLGLTPSPAPFSTPRSERRRPDSRAPDTNRLDRNTEANVQVLLRCRPLSDEEQRLNGPKVISCNEQKREVTLLQSIANKQVDKVFTFDKVFGPEAQQRLIYEHAVSPIVNEVLKGFNCTVFAYGQTGTGKTYTMEGGMKTKGGELSAEAGVIPRAVRQIFDTLEAQNADYSMKVTFLELYNEEITDLLAPEDSTKPMEDKQKKPISLMEDGKGGVMVRGLEEEAVYSANEIYSLLERGSAKRRSVDTLLNKHSSRSHAVFSISIHVKEETFGYEIIKCGKLNLVDLAGSENISRSGARESRAREAGEINKSLLVLGRVINALAERCAYIPYRDSKLTRLLRESLGGKAKTCFIATVSPSVHCMDETLSTLDYAFRARNIKNKPEVNQKISKPALQTDRRKEDVRAATEKNGVYIPHERFIQDEAEKAMKIEKYEKKPEILTVKPGEDGYPDTSSSLRQTSPFMKLKFSDVKEQSKLPYQKRPISAVPRVDAVEHLEKRKFSDVETFEEKKQLAELHATPIYWSRPIPSFTKSIGLLLLIIVVCMTLQLTDTPISTFYKEDQISAEVEIFHKPKEIFEEVSDIATNLYPLAIYPSKENSTHSGTSVVILVVLFLLYFTRRKKHSSPTVVQSSSSTRSEVEQSSGDRQSSSESSSHYGSFTTREKMAYPIKNRETEELVCVRRSRRIHDRKVASSLG